MSEPVDSLPEGVARSGNYGAVGGLVSPVYNC